MWYIQNKYDEIRAKTFEHTSRQNFPLIGFALRLLFETFMSTQAISISGKLINVCGVFEGMEDAKTKNTVTGAGRGCQSVVMLF